MTADRVFAGGDEPEEDNTMDRFRCAGKAATQAIAVSPTWRRHVKGFSCTQRGTCADAVQDLL